MPVILVALFAIALLVTCIGLFLSPKSSTPRFRNNSSASPRVRRLVETAVVVPMRESGSPVRAPSRARRRIVTSTSALVSVEEGRSMAAAAAIPARASRSMRVVNVDMDVVMVSRPRPRARVNQTRASISVPAFRKGLEDLLWSWKVAVPGLFALFLLSLCLFVTVFPHQAVWMPVWFGVQNAQAAPKATSSPNYSASQRLIRLGQLDGGQYDSTNEYDTWAYSACSAASMTVVINSYGHHYRITDILTVESQIHEITPDLGLLEEIGIQRTGAKFGFKTVWGHNYSLDQVIAAANSGTPVIVSFPPYKWAGGHLLVVRGGNKDSVLLADSSRLNMTQLTRERFLSYWGGFYAIMTPA